MKREPSKIKYRPVLKTLFIILALMLSFGWIKLNNPKNTYADEKQSAGIFVSPMSQNIILTPGEIYTGTVSVSNTSSSQTAKYTAKIGPYTRVKDTSISNDDYGGFDVNTITNNNAILNWTKIDKTGSDLNPNEKDIITYTIDVPKDAPAGAQYFAILIAKKENENSDNTNNSNKVGASITSEFQLVSTIYANVAGETVEKGSISENNMPSVLTTNKLEATSMVRNDGNIYTDATYTLQVWPLTSDEELCTNEEKAETSMILPNTERYHVQTCNLPAVGIFRAKQVVKIFGEESVLEKTIFVCPVWLMILAVVIVVAIITAIIIIIKKNKAKKSED